MKIEQVIVGHDAGWQKWPDTEDRDYSSVLALRREWQFGDLAVVCRYLPAYKCYLDAGMPDAVVPVFPWIDNTKRPPEPVMAAQLHALEAASRECQAVLWEHSYQCWPFVAEYIKSLFRLSILSFGDDCMGSSEIKTWPVAANFDALMYSMYVWDFETGRLTAPEYQARGLKRCYHIATSPTLGLVEELARWPGFSVAQKAAALRSGQRPDVGLCWVGLGGSASNRMRAAIVGALDGAPLEVSGIGKTAIHGIKMRDGHLGVRDPLHQTAAMGASIVPLYIGSALGVNVQQSSIFNSRLLDLWLCGVGQLICDPHGELAAYDIRAGEHYIAFDGSPEDMIAKAKEWIADLPRLADLIERAEAKAREFMAVSSWTAAYGRMYRDHRQQLEAGRDTRECVCGETSSRNCPEHGR